MDLTGFYSLFESDSRFFFPVVSVAFKK